MRTYGFALAAIVLTGCASFPTGRGVEETRALVTARGGAAPAGEGPVDCADPQSGVAALISEPLTADTAVRIALLCNASLAADYARLGISRAEAFQAGRLVNPTLSAAALDSSARGAPAQLELGVVQNFTSLLLRGRKKRLAEGEFLRTQQLLAGSVLELAAQAKADYFRLVGAQQIAAVRDAIANAMQTSGELADRFQEAGNLSARAVAEYHAAAAQATVDAKAADADVASAHLALQLTLGLPGTWSVPDALALPVGDEDALDALSVRADQNRLDLAAARGLVILLADSEQVTRKFRWLGDVSVGVSYERDPDRSRLLGPALSIQLPLFDQGQGAVARAGALSAWAQAEQRRLTLAVGAHVHLAHQQVMNSRSRVEEYRKGLIPQRQAVVARTQEEQNFMLVGVFELLGAKRAEFDAYQGYLEALRDYWVARAELERAVGAQLPSAVQLDSPVISTKELLTPPPAMHGMHHGDHSAMPGMHMDHTPAASKPANQAAPPHDMSDMPGMAMPPAKDPSPSTNIPSHDHHGATP